MRSLRDVPVAGSRSGPTAARGRARACGRPAPARSGAAITRSTSSSTTGSAMPTTLRLPCAVGVRASPRSRAARCRATATAPSRRRSCRSRTRRARRRYCARVDGAHPRASMPSRSRFFANGSAMRSNGGLVEQDLERATARPSRVDQLAASSGRSSSRPASSSSTRLAQVVAVVARAVGRRRLVLGGEHLVGDACRGSGSRIASSSRRSAGRSRRARSCRSSCACACTGRRTGSCSTTRSRTRSRAPGARARSWNSGRRRLKTKRLHAGRALVAGSSSLTHQAVAHGGDVVGGGPVLGGVLEAEVVLAGLEGLERDGVVAVVVVAHARRSCRGRRSPAGPAPQ